MDYSSNNNNNLILASFNCKSFKRSIEDIRSICSMSSVVCLQETWLLEHDIPMLSLVSNDFEYIGKSAVDSSAGILRGRPYGGLAILYRKCIFDSVCVIDCSSPRLAAVKLTLRDS